MNWQRVSVYHQTAGRYSVCFIASAHPMTEAGHFESWLGNTPNMPTWLGKFASAEDARRCCEVHALRVQR